MRRAFRVLKPGGKFAFTVWAGPEQNPGAKIVNDAVEAYADLNVGLPEGPPKYLYGDREECRQVLERVGFDGASMSYETRTVEWHHPHAGYYFEAERNAGVRTAGILARQSPETLDAIRVAIENGISQYAREDKFVLLMAAHVVVVSKSWACYPGVCSRRPEGCAHASRSEAATGRHYTIAPPQLEPAPAVQPKQ